MRITLEERNIIEFRLRLGMSTRAIARVLQRDHTVVAREIVRNGLVLGRYSASVAHGAAERRRHKKHERKLDKDPRLRMFVEDKIQHEWSPEEISEVLKTDQLPKMHGKRISTETIYQYIYTGNGRYKQLYRFLRVARKKRRKWFSRKHRKIAIQARISIHERPSFINDRSEIGHWEADLVEGRRRSSGVLCVQVERTTRLVRITKLENKQARETRACLKATCLSLPVKTFTFDNGAENAEHYILAKDYGIGTFFCDAYSPWQKGSVENMNKLIRQYIPKRTDAMKHVTANDVQRIQETLNNRPRKCLNYLTPNQAMQNYLRGGALEV